MIQHQLHPDLGLAVSTVTGEIGDDDLMASYRQLYRDPDWKPGFNEFVDIRRADLRKVTVTGLQVVQKLVEGHSSERFKSAFVVAHDVNHGVARMYEAFCDASPETVQVFRDAGEALTWLGAPTDLVE